jgi:hypothetical protein
VAYEGAREIDQSGLVGDRQQGAGDGAKVKHGTLFVMPAKAGHPVDAGILLSGLPYQLHHRCRLLDRPPARTMTPERSSTTL